VERFTAAAFHRPQALAGIQQGVVDQGGEIGGGAVAPVNGQSV